MKKTVTGCDYAALAEPCWGELSVILLPEGHRCVCEGHEDKALFGEAYKPKNRPASVVSR